MSERTTTTTTIGKGIEYATVAARSMEFHHDNEQCAVETSCEFKEGFVLFTAKVTTKKGVFTGHSMGKVGGQQKQFEKQETIAVGRALAFAGYLASGAIACAEEMGDLVTTMQLNSLKLKYATVYRDSLVGLDLVDKQQEFSTWCRKITGEEADFTDPGCWEPEWYKACWRELVGADDDVPFEE